MGRRSLIQGALNSLVGAGVGAGVGAVQQRDRDPAMGAELGALSGLSGSVAGQLLERTLTRGLPRVLRPVFTNEEGPRATRKRSLSQLTDVLNDDQLDIPRLRSRLDPNLPLTLTDLGGENVLSRVDVASQTPGAARNDAKKMVETRRRLYPSLIMDAVKAHLTPSFDLRKTTKDLQDARDAAAKKMYEDALYTKDPTTGALVPKLVSDPSLNPILDRLYDVGAFKKAETLAKAYGEAPPTPITPPDPVAGTPGTYKLTARQLDLVKQGLDGLISKTYGSAEPDRNLGRAYTSLKHELLSRLDPQLPGYEDARGVFSDFSTSMDALKAGRKFDAGHMDDNLDYFKSLDPSDQDFYRVGMGQRVKDVIGDSREGTLPIRKFFSTNDDKNLLPLFFHDPAEFDAFSSKLGRLMDMAETDNKIYGNSATQRRLQEEAAMKSSDLADSPLLNIFQHEGGLHSGVGMELLKAIHDDPAQLHKLTAADLTKLMLNPDYHANVKTLDDLQAAQRKARVGQILNDVSRWTGGVGGAAATSALATTPLGPAGQKERDPLAGGYAEGGRVHGPVDEDRGDLWRYLPLEPDYQKLRGQVNDAQSRYMLEPSPDASAALQNAGRFIEGGDLEAARARYEAEKQADAEYAAALEEGGGDEAYAARRVRNLGHIPDEHNTGTEAYLTPEGDVVTGGKLDEWLPGSDVVDSALDATGDWLTGAGGWSDSYHRRLPYARTAQERYRGEHPLMSAAAMGASLPLGAGLGALSKFAQLGKYANLARAVLAGAGMGATSGFLEGRGGFTPRLRSAGWGALSGGALGGALGAGPRALAARTVLRSLPELEAPHPNSEE